MGKINIDQSHGIVSTLVQNTDWGKIDFKIAGLQDRIMRNPEEAGRQFTAFLKNGGRMVVGEQNVHINRSMPFDPSSFIGEDWSIDEQDERSLELMEVNMTKVCLETMLTSDETVINGEKKLKRLKEAGYIRLDAKVFQILWENQYLIPERWKEKINGNIQYIFFDGTVLRNSSGNRSVLCLCWLGDEWHWGVGWLDSDWDANAPSVVLAS